MKKLALAILMAVGSASFCLAANESLDVLATIEAVNHFDMVANKVDATTDEWVGLDVPAIDFETLTLDPVNNIFTSDWYYAVEADIAINTGDGWTIEHDRSNIRKTDDAFERLNNHINVTFAKMEPDGQGGEIETQLDYVSYDNSGNTVYDDSDLNGGWLRVYYGIGTGDPNNPDASGVTPIGLDKPAGNYVGDVTFTLTVL